MIEEGPPFYYAQCISEECQLFTPSMDTKSEAIEVANRNCWRDVERDGLPEVCRRYLVQDESSDVFIANWEDGWKAESCDDDGREILLPLAYPSVAAWMPLPPEHETGSEE